MIRDEIFAQGPASVNREIRALIAEHGPVRRPEKELRPPPPPEVPPLRPAALEPAWSKRKLILLRNSAQSNSDSVVVAAALKLLRAETATLAHDADGNIDQRSIASLWNVAECIPGYAPAQDELFYLAHLKTFLEVYPKVLNYEWPGFLAKRFEEIMFHFDRTVRQFSKWRDFVSDAEKDRLTSEQAADVPALAKMMIAALREDEARNLIDPAILSALEVFQAPLQGNTARPERQTPSLIGPCKLLLANDVLESINNIAKRLAEAALGIKNLGSQNGTRLKTGLEQNALPLGGKDDEKTYAWMTRTLLGIITSAPTQALHSKFCWLKPIVSPFGP